MRTREIPILRNVILFAALGLIIPADGMATEQVVMSDGRTLLVYQSRGGALVERSELLDPREWAAAVWPSWNSSGRSIVFEGRGAAATDETGVYELVLADASGLIPIAVRRLNGRRHPALSGSGELLATVDRDSRLWVSSLDGKSVLLERGPRVSRYRPVVWVGNSSRLVFEDDFEIKILDVASGATRSTGITDAVPAAAMGGTGKVLCVASGRRILVLDTATGTFRIVKDYSGFSVYDGLFWDDRSDSILLARQTWGHYLRFSEGTDLFRVRLDGSEQRLLKNTALAGGFVLP